MKQKSWHLRRRTVLKGLGVSCFLPYLEAMAGDPRAEKAPRRLMSIYVPNGVSLPPAHMDELRRDWSWFPHRAGGDYIATKVMEPIQGLRR